MNELHRLVRDLLPDWSAGLRAAEHEDAARKIDVGRDGDLFKAVITAKPIKHGLGSAMLTGGYEGISFFLSSCDSTLPPSLNEFSLEVIDRPIVEGTGIAEWSWTFFHSVARYLPIRYAHAELEEEFRAKNIIDDRTGVRAVGVNLETSLPGVYWLNYFGSPYTKLLGKEVLLSTPAFHVEESGNGVVVALGADPAGWQSPASKGFERRSIDHLGSQHFFSKDEPTRRAVAPDFRAEVRSRNSQCQSAS